jgi:hypothetical protein
MDEGASAFCTRRRNEAWKDKLSTKGITTGTALDSREVEGGLKTPAALVGSVVPIISAASENAFTRDVASRHAYYRELYNIYKPCSVEREEAFTHLQHNVAPLILVTSA